MLIWILTDFHTESCWLKNAGAEAGGTNGTTVKIGDGNYTLDAKGKVSSLTPTIAPTIVLAANKMQVDLLSQQHQVLLKYLKKLTNKEMLCITIQLIKL